MEGFDEAALRIGGSGVRVQELGSKTFGARLQGLGMGS